MVISRFGLGAALHGAGRIAEQVAVLEEAWQAPARDLVPKLPLLQTAGALAVGLVELGELDRARQLAAEVATAPAEAERAWGRGAAAAVADLRLAEARRRRAVHGPAAALPSLRRAVDVAETWGHGTAITYAATSLAAALWAVGERGEARRTLDRAHEAASIDPPRPHAARQLADLETRLGRGSVRAARAHGALADELTDRELAVLRALQGPLTAREIGSELHLSINTIKGYTKSLYRKLGVVTRADAIARGRQLGLI